MAKPKFSWIPAYEEIATTLLGYEERQDELCSVVEEILGEHYEQMDPLTFFSMFNGKRKNFDKRVEAVRTIIERFRLKSPAPTDFDGLPVTNPQRWRFWDGKPDTIRHNWQLFRSAVTYADGKTDEFPIETDAKTLRGALEQENLVEGEESEYGLFVQKVNGVAASDNAYWAFYQYGEYLMTGVDTTPIADGDRFEIKHEEIQY